MKDKIDIKILFVIITLAFIIRIIYSIIAYSNNVMANYSDDNAYFHFGSEVLKQGVFVNDLQSLGTTASVIGPGIGWLLAAEFLIVGNNYLNIFILNSILSTLLVLSVLLILKNINCSKNIIYITSLICCLYPYYIMNVPTAGKEIWLYLMLSILTLLIIRILNNNQRLIYFILFSIVSFLLIHVDERYVPYIPLFYIFLIFKKHEPINKFSYKIKITLSILIFVLLCLPWLVRNYYIYSRIIIISVRTNNITEKIFGYDDKEYIARDSFPRGFISIEGIDSIKLGLITKNYYGEELHPNVISDIRNGSFPHKHSILENMCTSFISLWQPFNIKGIYYDGGYRYKVWSLKHNLIIGLSYGIILALSFYGYFLLYKKNKFVALIFGLAIVLHTLIHVLFIPFSQARYRIPIDFILIICAAFALNDISYKCYKKYGKNIIKD